MCGKCSAYKVVVEKPDSSFVKYNLVILVLFSITCSALGLSCYAVLKVQNITEDLNLLRMILSRSNIRATGDTPYQFGKKVDWKSDTENPLEASVVTGKFAEYIREPLERHKRGIIPDSLEEKASTENSSGFLEEEESLPLRTTDPMNNLHNIRKKAVNYDDSSDAEVFTPVYRNAHLPRNRNRGRDENELEIVNEFSPQAGRLKTLLAIHLNGDTSKYIYGQHDNFNGNGHLYHPQRTFVDWKKSDWVEFVGGDNNFETNNGMITIKQPGLYYIYAQIYYLDVHDMNGYRIYKNSDFLFQCTVTTHSSIPIQKGNTCYTGGVTYLNANDSISVGDISDKRYSLFEPGKSFFGMIRLGDTKNK